MPSQSPPLVLRFGAFGDMILMIPVLKLLEARFGAPCDVVSSGRWTLPLLQRVPAAREVVLLTSRRAPYWFNRSQQELVAWLRKRPAGPVYVFEPDEKPLALLRRAGIRPEWICTLRDFPRREAEHILTQSLRLASATPSATHLLPPRPAPDATPSPRPSLGEADRKDLAAWIEARGLSGAPLVLLQPGNKKTMKGGDRRRSSNVDYWPEANWAAVIEGVAATLPQARVILCGSPAERPLAQDIVAQLSPALRHIAAIAADDLPIVRLLALQERAHSMISVNTGPAHAAAAMGCPLIVMFTRHAHRAAELYAPVPTTAPVEILQPTPELAESGLDAIQPEAVLARWRATMRL